LSIVGLSGLRLQLADRARLAALTGRFRASPGEIAARTLKLLIEFVTDCRQTILTFFMLALQGCPLLLMTLIGLRHRIGSFSAGLGLFSRVTRLHLLVLPAMELLHLRGNFIKGLPCLICLLSDLAESLLDGVLGGFSQFRPRFRQGCLIGTPFLFAPIAFAKRMIGSLIRSFLSIIVLGNGRPAARSCRRFALCHRFRG
jgi:hypothetical protein